MRAIHKAALGWYARNARPFAWRSERDPYRILLVEMMSQQTQISRVIGYYERWLRVFPTVAALASASKEDVLREWSGLGYNSRALRLHSLANTIVNEHRGRLPRTVDALLALPGVGMYTAHAILCSAYRMHVPVVDVNIRRIFSRLFFEVRTHDEMQTEAEAWSIAARVLPKDDAYRWNQALMDIGALFCSARSPKCEECPFRTLCMSASSPVFKMPVKKKLSNEPAFKGVPRRLYRGKILKLLHAGPMSEDDIAQRLWSDFGEEESAWLTQVLGQMEKNELISRRGKRISVAA